MSAAGDTQHIPELTSVVGYCHFTATASLHEKFILMICRVFLFKSFHSFIHLFTFHRSYRCGICHQV